MREIKVERLMDGLLVREGAGVKLHRYIGADRTNDVEPFLLFDYFNSKDTLDFIAGFPPHPHRGFETITYLLQGSISHEDNQGHKGVVQAGDVQWMTAGKGIIHSEMPGAMEALQGVQLWLNLPAADKMRTPRYQEKKASELPIVKYPNGLVVKIVAGSLDSGERSPITEIATKPMFFDITLPSDVAFRQSISKDYQPILFVVKGAVSIGNQSIQEGRLAILSQGEMLEILGIKNSQCFLIAAMKLHEPIARYGPFVMNTQEEIMQALQDFRSGSF